MKAETGWLPARCLQLWVLPWSQVFLHGQWNKFYFSCTWKCLEAAFPSQ